MRRRLVVGEAVRTSAGLVGDAVLLEDGRVVATGPATDLRKPGLTEERYPGSVILPGIVDAHFHPLGYTAALFRLTLDDVDDVPGLIEKVAGAAASLPPDSSLVGARFDDQQIGRFPTRSDLDQAAERPVLIYRYCGHVAVANTAALELAGIGPSTVDPLGGSIDRDGDGIPTGVLRETAIAPAAAAVGTRTAGLDVGDVLEATRGLAGLGLTSLGAIIDLGGDLWCGVGNELELLTEAGPDLPLRMTVYPISNDPRALNEAAARLESAGPWIRFGGLKLFADGSFGGHTAAMHRPFADHPVSGTLRLSDDSIELARAALSLGGQLAVHAIGDRAVGKVLDMFEHLLDEGADPTDLRIEHVSVITERDVARMAGLGVTAVVQPAFLMSEAAWLEQRVGTERISNTYAFRTLLEAGIPMAGSSDCPVEPPSPWWGMAAARDRAGINPSENLTGSQSLALFTDGANAALRRPHWGPAGDADLTIVDRDPVEASPDELRTISVVGTWIEGEPVGLSGSDRVWV